jgi:hypothetical protein
MITPQALRRTISSQFDVDENDEMVDVVVAAVHAAWTAGTSNSLANLWAELTLLELRLLGDGKADLAAIVGRASRQVEAVLGNV